MTDAEIRHRALTDAERHRIEKNAVEFLRATQARRPRFYRGGNAQAYQNWRTEWLVECLRYVPLWNMTTPVYEARVATGDPSVDPYRHAQFPGSRF